jgi:hypothetical protein
MVNTLSAETTSQITVKSSQNFRHVRLEIGL